MTPAPPPASGMQGVLRLLSLPTGHRFGAAPTIAAFVFALIAAASLGAPLYVPYDPLAIDAVHRLQGSSPAHLMGTDSYGRDLFSRVMLGGRVSLFIGVGAALASIAAGLVLGLAAGGFRAAEAVIMRVTDALMAIPSVLLAIAFVALNGTSVWSVICAITVSEVPRVVRLVRAVVLSAREEPYVEAAVALGSSRVKILWQHLMPNTVAPLVVQGSYVCASAILVEAILSFLGAGVGTETPTWGNVMAQGRLYFQIKPMLIFWPGLMLSACILSINLLGDAARDLLDPRLKAGGALR